MGPQQMPQPAEKSVRRLMVMVVIALMVMIWPVRRNCHDHRMPR
jgi:hypothetical protein